MKPSHLVKLTLSICEMLAAFEAYADAETNAEHDDAETRFKQAYQEAIRDLMAGVDGPGATP